MILIGQGELREKGPQYQKVNIEPTKNHRFAHFHDAPKTNFILFAVPSPNSQIVYVQ